VCAHREWLPAGQTNIIMAASNLIIKVKVISSTVPATIFRSTPTSCIGIQNHQSSKKSCKSRLLESISNELYSLVQTSISWFAVIWTSYVNLSPW